MDIKTWYKKMAASNSPTKKIIGVVFFILGFLALITPLTPGSWLIFVGLELLGFRLAIWDKFKNSLLNEQNNMMSRNKILLVLVTVLLITGVAFTIYKNRAPKMNTQPPITTNTDPLNATYTVEGVPVQFKNGSEEIKTDDNSTTTTKYKIFEANTIGDLNADGLTDTGVVLTVDSGGSGTFYYAAAAIKTSTGYLGTNAVLMGDRIAPQPAEIRDGLLIINFADRKAGQDFSVKPSQGKSLYLEYFKNTLITRPEAVQLTSPFPYAEITSPLKITGQAKGTWFFEASFPVMLTDWDGKIIATGIAQAKADWMTENFVPFEATLTFTKPQLKNNGSLILKKDNPSGLPKNDAAYELPIIFK